MKILLIKLNHLGDTLLATPTICWLRQQFPGAELDVMVRSGCEEVLRNNPDITRVIPIASPEKERRTWGKSLREFLHAFRLICLSRRYDLAFDLSNSDRAKVWVLLSRARIRAINDHYRNLGWKGRVFNRFSSYDWYYHHQTLKDFRTVTEVLGVEATAPGLCFHPQTSESELRRKLPALGERNCYAVIHPTSRWAFKQWLPERWAEVADRLRGEHDLQVIFSCGPEAREKEHVRLIRGQARGQHDSTDGGISLSDLGRLLGGARLFLGVDTVAMHLAAALQTPIVAVFGPSLEWAWGPWHCRHELILKHCPCKLASHFTCDKAQGYDCLRQITVTDVLDGATRLLASTADPASVTAATFPAAPDASPAPG
jgi:lipopolysaccharide heptosyltransferase III